MNLAVLVQQAMKYNNNLAYCAKNSEYTYTSELKIHWVL